MNDPLATGDKGQAVYVCPWGHARTESQHDEAKRTPCRICTAYNRDAEKAATWTAYPVDEFMGIHNAHLEQSFTDMASGYTAAVMRELRLLHEGKLPEPATGPGAKP